MKPFIFIGINLILFFSNSATDIRSLQEFSFLSLKESSDEALGRKDARITLNECSAELIEIILANDQSLKLELSSYHCYLKNLVKAVESCKKRCKISQNIGKCKGIEDRLAVARQKHESLKMEQAKWTSRLIFCIKCRALTEYKLIESRGGIGKRARIGGIDSENDPSYTIQHLFNSFVTRDVSNYELSYILSRINLYESTKKKLCKGRDRALCKCANSSLKELTNKQSSLRSTLLSQDAYQRRWFTFNTNNGNSIPLSGEAIDSIENECLNVLEIDAQVQNEAEGISNPGFSQEELSQVSTT